MLDLHVSRFIVLPLLLMLLMSPRLHVYRLEQIVLLVSSEIHRWLRTIIHRSLRLKLIWLDLHVTQSLYVQCHAANIALLLISKQLLTWLHFIDGCQVRCRAFACCRTAANLCLGQVRLRNNRKSVRGSVVFACTHAIVVFFKSASEHLLGGVALLLLVCPYVTIRLEYHEVVRWHLNA